MSASTGTTSSASIYTTPRVLGTLVADSRPVVASTTYTQDAESMGREGKPLVDFNSK